MNSFNQKLKIFIGIVDKTQKGIIAIKKRFSTLKQDIASSRDMIIGGAGAMAAVGAGM